MLAYFWYASGAFIGISLGFFSGSIPVWIWPPCGLFLCGAASAELELWPCSLKSGTPNRLQPNRDYSDSVCNTRQNKVLVLIVSLKYGAEGSRRLTILNEIEGQ